MLKTQERGTVWKTVMYYRIQCYVLKVGKPYEQVISSFKENTKYKQNWREKKNEIGTEIRKLRTMDIL